jgi:hypothetical protein
MRASKLTGNPKEMSSYGEEVHSALARPDTLNVAEADAPAFRYTYACCIAGGTTVAYAPDVRLLPVNEKRESLPGDSSCEDHEHGSVSRRGTGVPKLRVCLSYTGDRDIKAGLEVRA